MVRLHAVMPEPMPSHNLAALPAFDRQRLDIDKRAAFVMWSLVLEQPRSRAKDATPMTRREIADELQATPAEHHAYHLERLQHWRDHYTAQLITVA